MPWRVTVIDDRSRRLTLAPSEMLPQGAGGGERAARLREASRAPPDPHTRAEVVRAVFIGLLMFLVVPPTVLVPLWVAFRSGLPWWARIMAVIMSFVGSGVVTYVLGQHLAAQRVARWAVRAGYCGSCGHDLTGLSPEADGCRVCAECGAAWR